VKYMKNRFLASSPTSLSTTPPQEPALTKKRGKKLYVAIAAILAIVIIVAALMFIPQGNANVISLGVHYTQGEKLTYAMTTSYSSDTSGTSTNLSTDTTITIEVVSLVGDTYTLNYTKTSSLLGTSIRVSKIVEVKQGDMITALALWPVAFQTAAAIGNSSDTNPFLTAFFNQSQAKVGDTWNIPLTSADSASSAAGNLTITFKAIQDLNVQAGNFHVFRMDFSTNIQESQSSFGSIGVQLSGTAYLQTETCKQVQSTLQINMNLASIRTGSNSGETMTITSTLTHDTA
jgi:hypothetical protein